MAGEDPKYLEWIRHGQCSVPKCWRGPIAAHHSTARRGLSQKAHDHEAMPLCWICHDDFHNAKGYFRSMTHEERTAWQDAQVVRCRALYLPKEGFF